MVQRHIAEVRFCFERELMQTPELAGQLSVRFVIDPSGTVTSAALEGSTLANPRVEGCVMQAVRRWTFPASDGDVNVLFPFVFSWDRD